MKARSFLTAAVSAVLLIAAPARGDDIAGRLSIAVQGGTQSEVAGGLLKAAQGTLVGKSAAFTGRNYRDIYQPDLRLSASLGYGLNERFEIVLRGIYYKTEPVFWLEAGNFDGETLFALFHPPTFDASQDTGEKKIKEYGVEVALRYYLAPQARMKSYFALVAGMRAMDDVLVSLSIPDAGTAVLNVPFSRSGKAPVVGVDLGFGFEITPTIFVGLDTGLRYQSAADGYDELSQFTTIDNSDGRWISPVSVVIGARF